MSTVIPPELEAFVESEIASGKYRSREEVLTEALRLLREREGKLERLRTDLQAGLNELEAGEMIEISDEQEQRQFFEAIQRRGNERLALKKRTS